MCTESRRCLRAPDTGAEEILERDRRRGDTRQLRCLRVVRREGHQNPGVVDGVACRDIRVQILCKPSSATCTAIRYEAKEGFTYSKEQSAVGRACAGDLDGDALRVWNAVAVAGARGVDAGLHPELGDESGVDAAAGRGGGGGGRGACGG